MFQDDHVLKPVEMPLVDGFGDEVLVLLGIIVVGVVVAFAWLSTKVSSPSSSYVLVQYDSSSLDVEDEQRNGTVYRSAGETDEFVGSAISRSAVLSTSDMTVADRGVPLEDNVLTDANRHSFSDSQLNPGCNIRSDESERKELVVKLRFLDDSHRLVETRPSQCIGEFKRQNFARDLEEGKVVRLIYRGQLLRDDSRSLASYGLFDNCVVHCHISRVPYTAVEPAADVASSVDRSSDYRGAIASISFDIGSLVYALFGVKFAFLWAALYLYPDYFDSTSLLSLLFCSLVFLMFCLSAGRRRNAEGQSPRVTVTAITSTDSSAS
uniref:Ubiquitin-like domain-containing protein n=1 Tax=Trichuris muris TaxID=70415 RepID=A0A5S6Q2B5_TRIMR